MIWVVVNRRLHSVWAVSGRIRFRLSSFIPWGFRHWGVDIVLEEPIRGSGIPRASLSTGGAWAEMRPLPARRVFQQAQGGRLVESSLCDRPHSLTHPSESHHQTGRQRGPGASHETSSPLIILKLEMSNSFTDGVWVVCVAFA